MCKFYSTLRHFMPAFAALAMTFSMASCGSDEPDEPDDNGTNTSTTTPANPMAGKTIRCVENKNSDYIRISTNYSIVFKSSTRFVQILKQSVEEYDLGTKKWSKTLDLDKELPGTYEYTPTKITLRYDEGGSTTLTKVPAGWDDNGYVYK